MRTDNFKKFMESFERNAFTEAVMAGYDACFESRQIHGLGSYDYDELCDMVRADIQNTIDDEGLSVEIVDVQLHGSRLRGDNRPDSDLDAVVEYRSIGDRWREDALFDELNSHGLSIEGIDIDINPISVEDSGDDMESYMQRSNEYDAEKAAK